MKSAASLALMASIGISTAVFGQWQRLPYSETIPVNLANKAIPGTSMVSSDGIGSANSLISGGISEPVALPSGKSEAVIQVVGQHVIDEVRFSNDGAEGKVSVASSVDAKKWQPVGQTVFVSNMNEVQVRFAGAQARYVRVNFELAKGSTIRGFGIYGATTDKDYKLVQREVGNTSASASKQSGANDGNAPKQPGASDGNAPKESKNEGGSGATVNLAAGGGARAIYAFPAPINTNEAELRKNVFRFPKTKERFRVIIYDLGSPRKIKQFASAYSERPTRLEVFAFEQLPEKKDWRGKLTLDPAIFSQTKPVAAGEDARGVGHMKLVPEKPLNAQYVALRFEPNYNRQANTSGDEEEWSAGLAAAMIPFSGFAREFSFSERVQLGQPIGNDRGETFDISGVELGATVIAGFKMELQALFNTKTGPDSNKAAQKTQVSQDIKTNDDGTTTETTTYTDGTTTAVTTNTDGTTTSVTFNPATGTTTTVTTDTTGKSTTVTTDSAGNTVTGEGTTGADTDPALDPAGSLLSMYANRNPSGGGSGSPPNPPGVNNFFNVIDSQGFTPTNLDQLQALLNTLEKLAGTAPATP